MAFGDITRTQNVSEYMLVLALCLVQFVATKDLLILIVHAITLLVLQFLV